MPYPSHLGMVWTRFSTTHFYLGCHEKYGCSIGFTIYGYLKTGTPRYVRCLRKWSRHHAGMWVFRAVDIVKIDRRGVLDSSILVLLLLLLILSSIHIFILFLDYKLYTIRRRPAYLTHCCKRFCQEFITLPWMMDWRWQWQRSSARLFSWQ